MNVSRLAAWVGIALCVAGCAQRPLQADIGVMPPGYAPVSSHADHAWHRACFAMPFDDHGAPRWAMDLLLADRVAGPAIARHADAIPLWRFHRRATRDGAGHRFSLLFYTDAATAAQLFAELDGEPLVPALVSAGYLRSMTRQCAANTLGPEPEASSDRKWDLRLQRTWPYFIMGVSAHWLALIAEVGADVPLKSDDPAGLLARYQGIEAQVDAIWREQGEHAYLHHLNAVFGYEPLLIRKLMGF